MDTVTKNLRGLALDRIAALSASAAGTRSFSEMDRIFNAVLPRSQKESPSSGSSPSAPHMSPVPMPFKEFEILIALSKSAASIRDLPSAEKLLYQLSPYLTEIPSQVFASSHLFRAVEPSPWESLTFHLGSAMLAMTLNHPSLQIYVFETILSFLGHSLRIANSLPHGPAEASRETTHGRRDEVVEAVTTIASLLGYLNAATAFPAVGTIEEKFSVITLIQRILSERFLISVETSLSTIRSSHSGNRQVRNWKGFLRHYGSADQPLGVMLLQSRFMALILSIAGTMVTTLPFRREEEVLDVLEARYDAVKTSAEKARLANASTIEALAEIASQQMRHLDDGADYVRLSSMWRERLGLGVKACALTVFLICTLCTQQAAMIELLVTWLDETMSDPIQMADDHLARVVLQCMAILAKFSLTYAVTLGRSLPLFIVHRAPSAPTVTLAAKSLSSVLQLLSEDAVISALYALGVVLSTGNGGKKEGPGTTPSDVGSDGSLVIPVDELSRLGSATTSSAGSQVDTSIRYHHVIEAIAVIAASCNDRKIAALAQSLLLQKFRKISYAVDATILIESAALASVGGSVDFRSLLRLYERIAHDSVISGNRELLDAIRLSRIYLSLHLERGSPLQELYLVHLLETIVSKGDVEDNDTDTTRGSDFEHAAEEIAQLLPPLAVLVSSGRVPRELLLSEEICSLGRDTWYNLIIHGFSLSSGRGKRFSEELRLLAINTPPLRGETGFDRPETDFDLDTVLRRGMHSLRALEQKKALLAVLPSCEADIKILSYPRVIFLRAVLSVESLRATSGDCATAVTYFTDSTLSSGSMGRCMAVISEMTCRAYIERALAGIYPDFSVSKIAKQLARLFIACCHRIEAVQHMACLTADWIIKSAPSALCQSTSLFALLELLSLMRTSCLDAERDEDLWRSSFTSSIARITIELSDDYELRRRTLRTLHAHAKEWVMWAMNVAPLDIKSLLQTYLSEYDEEAVSEKASLGRSFALEVGSAVPETDLELRAIDRESEYSTDATSSFMAQYTIRQQYKQTQRLLHQRHHQLSPSTSGGPQGHAGLLGTIILELQLELQDIESKRARHEIVRPNELRSTLQKAAALLGGTTADLKNFVYQLVAIPFSFFTKEAINLGISTWMRVINDNSSLETRILAEVANGWEQTVHSRLGVFDARLHQKEPFFVKEEFAPSNSVAVHRRQKIALGRLEPHMLLLQFLESRFHATRLVSVSLQNVFLRLVQITLRQLKHPVGHPLARKFHFQFVLFGFSVLKYSAGLRRNTQLSLKEQILSAGLGWFSHSPRWSFGGNRVQIRAELLVLATVENALRSLVVVNSTNPAQESALHSKQNLLRLLLRDEQVRLTVWLYPLDHTRRHLILSGNPEKSLLSEDLIPLHLHTAWMENPALAVQLLGRFPSASLANGLRRILLSCPEKTLADPDAVQILLGSALPGDVSTQLQFLLYWAPVDPITAVNYVLPPYRNHPFIVQYAMRALESHSVDVTFFYVPQIVQTLRYDVLGYVERYIVETAKFSQLFAHQIIWNMKANAYKDEDSEVPDGIKPMLDQVTDGLISSFSGADLAFYEREFSFFAEVTGISGKLRPYIKRSKAEKKQKIEEELRKIKVEVGVYLPSNPDGVVIGIDRKSGKPLQSHAKAPYMATFRIKKNTGEMEAAEQLLEEANRDDPGPQHEQTIEVWQSAIFKVGDDCRQDVLALQLIAAFRGIFHHVGLDVYVYPYRVTATAPGCGVIDVLPAISRDMLGRETVNGLYDYFVSKYGGETSIRFQEARSNFVKSMAAYSMISYLLQFKDRHNGNIMIDEAGHILHIDFGFCFDIAPGGIRFERAPFKLTSEMVAVMGGSTDAASYRWFEALCIKAFLAARPYAGPLLRMVRPMLDSGLPCFKPESLQHLRERFVLDKSERGAADFMRDLIKKSQGSYSTKTYDQFQLMTNGIPY